MTRTEIDAAYETLQAVIRNPASTPEDEDTAFAAYRAVDSRLADERDARVAAEIAAEQSAPGYLEALRARTASCNAFEDAAYEER